mmetsp:Transcript_19252/g.56116  ORF Transcript_19252/g.56116 Transcript_19252/m.56116 type:complete len:251 (-) Transcript_19252:486-1238(-)
MTRNSAAHASTVFARVLRSRARRLQRVNLAHVLVLPHPPPTQILPILPQEHRPVQDPQRCESTPPHQFRYAGVQSARPQRPGEEHSDDHGTSRGGGRIAPRQFLPSRRAGHAIDAQRRQFRHVSREYERHRSAHLGPDRVDDGERRGQERHGDQLVPRMDIAQIIRQYKQPRDEGGAHPAQRFIFQGQIRLAERDQSQDVARNRRREIDDAGRIPIDDGARHLHGISRHHGGEGLILGDERHVGPSREEG